MIKVTAHEGETADELLARFKRQVKSAGILSECRLRESFLPKKLRRKMKADLNRKMKR